MKFENIKVGIKIQHKESGKVFEVTAFGFAPVLNQSYTCSDGTVVRSVLTQKDADLFRKYKGD